MCAVASSENSNEAGMCGENPVEIKFARISEPTDLPLGFRSAYVCWGGEKILLLEIGR